MVEDSEPDIVDADEFMRQLEAERERDRERATFEWCQTIREAGKRYREYDDVETIADDMDRDGDRIQEALTVYRLIFEEPPDHMATKTIKPARAFFALDQDLEDVDVDDDVVEELIREFVGSWYREYDLEGLPIGDPPESDVPPPPYAGYDVDFDFSITTGLPAGLSRMLSTTGEVYRTAAAVSRIHSMPAIQGVQQLLDDSFSTAVAGLMKETRIPSTAVRDLQGVHLLMDDALSTAVADITTAVDVPSTVATDIATLHASALPNLSVVPAQPTVGTNSVQKASARTTTAKATPKTAIAKTTPSQSPSVATVDSTLPDADALTADLVFELPTLFVESILSTGQARVWFSQLDKEDQTAAVALLLGVTAYGLTMNPASVPLAVAIAPAVRKRIVVDLT